MTVQKVRKDDRSGSELHRVLETPEAKLNLRNFHISRWLLRFSFISQLSWNTNTVTKRAYVAHKNAHNWKWLMRARRDPTHSNNSNIIIVVQPGLNVAVLYNTCNYVNVGIAATMLQ